MYCYVIDGVRYKSRNDNDVTLGAMSSALLRPFLSFADIVALLDSSARSIDMFAFCSQFTQVAIYKVDGRKRDVKELGFVSISNAVSAASLNPAFAPALAQLVFDYVK